MTRYSEATAQADHVTTRLAMDASDAMDSLSRAESTLESVGEILFELDRLVGFYGDANAEAASAAIRERIGSLALTAQKAAEKPVNAVRWSPDARISLIAKTTIRNNRANPRTSNLLDVSFEDCVD